MATIDARLENGNAASENAAQEVAAPDLLSGQNPSAQQQQASQNNQRQQQDPINSEPISGPIAAGSSNVNYVAMEMAQGGPMEGQQRHTGDGGDDDDDDDDDDNHSQMAASIVSSVLTADGIHDVPGFMCVCLVILLGDMSRGVMFPSMWPLVESLGGSQVMLGYSVAAFSFGRVLVNPLFGAWSHSMGYTKTLLIAISVLLVGTMVYAQVQNIGRPEFLIVAQTVLGVGSGTLGVTRAFVADVTAKRNRTTYMAWMTAVQYGGFTVTPIIGATFNYLFRDGKDIYLTPNGLLRLNMFTAPAFFMAIMCVITLVILSLYFRDRQRITITKDAAGLAVKKSTRRAAIEDFANANTWFFGLTVYDCCILGCMLLNVSTKGSIASFETLGIAVAESHFDMASSRAGAIVAVCGALGVAALLSMGRLEKYMSDVQIISTGMAFMIAGIAILVNIEEGVTNPSWRYVTAIFLVYSIGYPIGHTAVIGLFSKIVGRRPQGVLLGWFASAGSLARIIFPIMSGYISNNSGVNKLFELLIVVLLLSGVFVNLARKTLNLLSS